MMVMINMMMMMMVMGMMMVMISSGLTHPYEAEDPFPLGCLQKVASLQSDHYFSLFWGGKCSQFFQFPFCRLVALNAPITSSSPLSKLSQGWMCRDLRDNLRIFKSFLVSGWVPSWVLSCIRLRTWLVEVLPEFYRQKRQQSLSSCWTGGAQSPVCSEIN